MTDDPPPRQAEQEAIKREYYQRGQVVENYETARFGSPAGQWVKATEENAIEQLLGPGGAAPTGVALDVPVGTGRMIPLLRRHASRVIASDLSAVMLQEARRHAADEYLLADAASLPLAPGSVDLVLSNRFLFHLPVLDKYFQEVARVLKPGGAFVFDVYNWSPKSWIPGPQRKWGGRMATHSRSVITACAQRHRLTVAAQAGVFALPPMLYLRLPLPAARLLDRMSLAMLGGYTSKVYYLLRKAQ